jgi:anti-sigma-K factor RskA
MCVLAAWQVEASRVKLEYSQVHQHHLRVTKKDQALLKKAEAAGGADALRSVHDRLCMWRSPCALALSC